MAESWLTLARTGSLGNARARGKTSDVRLIRLDPARIPARIPAESQRAGATIRPAFHGQRMVLHAVSP
jgi:hypothetical protein